MSSLTEIEESTNGKIDIKESDFFRGLKLGLPIAMGYVPVSFTFGLLAVKGGLSVWLTVLISLTNLTSAGQFAGTNLIIAGAPVFEIGLATLVINIRYSLMSLSLSQKTETKMPLVQKLVWGFGVTDETFSVASMESGKITSKYLYGLITLPYLGWFTGTLLGAISSKMLPSTLQSAMGIALYAMFIALVIPSCRKSLAAGFVCLVAILISVGFKYIPQISNISAGWAIIIATLVACTLGAIFFPRREEDA